MSSGIDLFKYYREMCDKNIIMSFKGAITQEILVDLGEIIKNHVADFRYRPEVVRRVFLIFVEVAQNILHHSAEKVSVGNSGEKGSGIVMMSETENYFKIVSGNLITHEDAGEIEESCLLINSLDKEGLKKAFLEKINKPLAEGKKSPGLGLLEIARKAKSKIEFKIEKVNREHSFFFYTVTIEKQGSNR